MIRAPGVDGVAFTGAIDGDQLQAASRARVSDSLAISREWATVTQVHGARVVRANSAGVQGDADALWTSVPDLPLAVLTADCFGVALVAESAVGVAHAGWRGVAGGVVAALVEDMAASGNDPQAAVIGPGIGPCCFEVGDEVAERFSGHQATTTWGTRSVSLATAIRSQLEPIATAIVSACTRHEAFWFSHRRDQTRSRMATIVWKP